MERTTVSAVTTRRASRSVEIRRRVAGRRARDSARRGPHRPASRAARRRRVRAGGRHRSAARGCAHAAPGEANEATRIAAVLSATTSRDRARSAAVGCGAGARCSHRSTRPRASTASSAAPSRVLGHIPPRASDILVSRGERMSAALLAAVLSRSGRRAQYVDAGEHRRDRRHSTAAPRRTFPRPDDAPGVCCGRSSPRARRPSFPASSAQAPDGSLTTLGRGGIRSDGDAAGRALGARKVVLWKDVRGHPHRGSAAGAGRAPDPAAAPSRGGGGRALRSEGPPSARAHPDRRHPHRAARAIVPRSRGARHRSLGAPLDGDAIRSRRSRSCADRRSSPSPARAWSACTASRRGRSAAIEAEQLSVSTIFQASSESSIGFTLAEVGSATARSSSLRRAFRDELSSGLIDNVTARPGMAVIAVVGDGMAGSARHCRARVLGARDRRHQRRRDRAGIVGAKHLVRCDGGPGGGGGAPRPRGVSAVEDRRRPAAGSAADRRRVPRVRPRRPCAGRSDGRAGQRPARRAGRRPARSIGLRLRAARHLATPAAAS